jgi:uncharacterized metal-binding protein (TIGR02443 family)
MSFKMAPCPNCKSDESLAVYRYESGWQHVECNKCWYLGPGEGSTKAAIKSHNAAALAGSLTDGIAAL